MKRTTCSIENVLRFSQKRRGMQFGGSCRGPVRDYGDSKAERRWWAASGLLEGPGGQRVASLCPCNRPCPGDSPRALTFLGLFSSAFLYPGFLSDSPAFPWRAPWKQPTEEREWLGAAGCEMGAIFSRVCYLKSQSL